jgi:putative Mg2+ transporter-C (MgtC) family protein
MNDLTISSAEILTQLSLAIILGGLIGLERERKNWFAGLRTHMLVCLGATLTMIVSQYGFAHSLHKELVVLDPSRVAAQVISGIGFLGAGAILVWRNIILGLTTAASLWTVAAIGLAVGGGLYLAAIAATFLILIVLAGIKPLEKVFSTKHQIKKIYFTSINQSSLMRVDSLLKTLNLREFLTELKIDSSSEHEHVQLFFRDNADNRLWECAQALKELPGVEKIEIIE